MDGWQLQCCGDSVEVGQAIHLSTTSRIDREFLSLVLGEERAASLTDYEDHHDVSVGPTSPLNGTVEEIEAVYCRYELRDGALHPIGGTSQTVPRDEVNGWEPEADRGDLNFVGYVVVVRDE